MQLEGGGAALLLYRAHESLLMQRNISSRRHVLGEVIAPTTAMAAHIAIIGDQGALESLYRQLRDGLLAALGHTHWLTKYEMWDIFGVLGRHCVREDEYMYMRAWTKRSRSPRADTSTAVKSPRAKRKRPDRDSGH